jgi:hypothetical protein
MPYNRDAFVRDYDTRKFDEPRHEMRHEPRYDPRDSPYRESGNYGYRDRVPDFDRRDERREMYDRYPNARYDFHP